MVRKVAEVQTRKNRDLGKGLGIKPEEENRYVANKNVIDCNKRAVSDKVNKSEPRFTE